MSILFKLSSVLHGMGLIKESSEIDSLIPYNEEDDMLDAILNDEITMLDSEQEERLADWEGISNFLLSIGSKISRLSKPFEGETEYYRVDIPKDRVKEGKPNSFIIDSKYHDEFKRNDIVSWVQRKIDDGKASDWVDSGDLDVTNIVYHGTPSDNLENILEEGLVCMSESRGISNRNVGGAIFTSVEQDEVSSYGDAILEINLEKMKEDGVLPGVFQEPDIEYWKDCDTFAYKFGLWLGDSVNYEYEQGMSPNTYIIMGRIPPEYIKVVSE